MNKNTQCIVCGESSTSDFYKGLLKCGNCGYIFANLSLSDEELQELYRKDYFFGEEYSDYIADQRVLQKNFKLRMNTLKPFLDPDRHKRLFEIGSAYGFFLDLVRDRFPGAAGIDITADGVHHARTQLGLDVRQGDFLTEDFGDRKWDVVCFWDTIEHLRSPHLYLEKASKHMESGAILTLTTGDIGSLNARIKKQNWRLIHPPTHAHYFDKKTMERMLSNYGFEVLYNRPCGFYRSVDQVANYIFVVKRKMPWLYTVIKKCGLGGLDFYLNLFDIMYVIARKR